MYLGVEKMENGKVEIWEHPNNSVVCLTNFVNVWHKKLLGSAANIMLSDTVSRTRGRYELWMKYRGQCNLKIELVKYLTLLRLGQA